MHPNEAALIIRSLLNAPAVKLASTSVDIYRAETALQALHSQALRGFEKDAPSDPAPAARPT